MLLTAMKTRGRSEKALRALGWLVGTTEMTIPPNAGRSFSIRKDLFGLFDSIALGMNVVVGIQSTTRPQMSAHMRKYLADPETLLALRTWLVCPTRRFEIWGWAKEKNRWTATVWDVAMQEDGTIEVIKPPKKKAA